MFWCIQLHVFFERILQYATCISIIYICILRTICVAHSRFIIWWSVWCKHIPRGEYKWCLPDYGFIGWSTARLQSIGAPKQIELDLKVMFWKTTESNMAFVRPFQYGNFGVVANMSWRCEGFIHLPQACFPKKRILSYLQNNQRKHLKISEFGRCVFSFVMLQPWRLRVVGF